MTEQAQRRHIGLWLGRRYGQVLVSLLFDLRTNTQCHVVIVGYDDSFDLTYF